MENDIFASNNIAPIQPQKKRGLSKLLISGVVLLVLTVAGFATYILTSNTVDIENPPEPQLTDSAITQGFIGSGTYLEFSDADYARTKDYGTSDARKYGVQLFYADKDMTIKEILNSIKPQDKLKLLLLHYTKNVDLKDFVYPLDGRDYDKDGQPENIFYTYPAGKYVETKRIADADLDSYKIKANEGFFLVVSNNFETWNLKGVDEAPRAEKINLNTADRGWHLYATADFPALYESCSNRVVRAFSSKGSGSDFEIIDLNNSPDLKEGAYMAWFYLSGDAGTCRSQGSNNGNDICTNGELKSSDAEICVSNAWRVCDDSNDGDRELSLFTCTSGEWIMDEVPSGNTGDNTGDNSDDSAGDNPDNTTGDTTGDKTISNLKPVINFKPTSNVKPGATTSRYTSGNITCNQQDSARNCIDFYGEDITWSAANMDEYYKARDIYQAEKDVYYENQKSVDADKDAYYEYMDALYADFDSYFTGMDNLNPSN